MAPTLLITGAGRGIGLEWARQELEAGSRVIATARDPRESPDLRALEARSAGRLRVLGMDVTAEASVEAAAREVAADAGSIDVLVNNAGIIGAEAAAALGPPVEDLRSVLEVNAVGPYRVTRAFLPLLRQGAGKRVVFVTSRMGSIGDRPSGGRYAYRMSKAALNMLGANLAEDLRPEGFLCLIFHPGWVKTRMGGAGASLPLSKSVSAMRATLARATPDWTGRFVDREGGAIPW